MDSSQATRAGITSVGVVLLSLFVYPGTGHLVLRKPMRGLAWAAAFTILLVGGLGSGLWGLMQNITDPMELMNVDFSKLISPFSILLSALSLLPWAGSAIDAATLAVRRNRDAVAAPALEAPSTL